MFVAGIIKFSLFYFVPLMISMNSKMIPERKSHMSEFSLLLSYISRYIDAVLDDAHMLHWSDLPVFVHDLDLIDSDNNFAGIFRGYFLTWARFLLLCPVRS